MAKDNWSDPAVAGAVDGLRAWVSGQAGNPPDSVPRLSRDSYRLGWGVEAARRFLEVIDDAPVAEAPWLRPDEAGSSSDWCTDGASGGGCDDLA